MRGFKFPTATLWCTEKSLFQHPIECPSSLPSTSWPCLIFNGNYISLTTWYGNRWRKTTQTQEKKILKKKSEPWNRFPYLHFCFVSKLVQFGMRSKTNEISICYVVWQKLCILMMCCVSSHCRLWWNLSERENRKIPSRV